MCMNCFNRRCSSVWLLCRRSASCPMTSKWPHSIHTRTCGCSEPRPWASISPLNASTGPSMPAPVLDAAAPSLHHSRAVARAPPRRQSSVSGRTFRTCWKKRRMRNSNCTVCATGSDAMRRSISRYEGKSSTISSVTLPRSSFSLP